MKDKDIIVSNQVHCLKCDDKPFSAHVHDYRECKCGNIAVDGGQEYLRRVGSLDDTVKDISIILPHDVIMKAVVEYEVALKSGRNTLGLVYAVIRGMRNGGFDFENGTVGK